jgi:peroxiredoxin
MKKIRLISLTIFASLVLGSFVTPASALRGVAPDFQALDLAGREIQLSKLRGCGVVIQFAASWCGFCIQQAPRLVEAHRQTRSKGVLFMVVNIYDDSDDDARSYASQHGITFPVIRNHGDAIAKAYRVSGVPHVVLIAPNGTVRKVLRGHSPAYNFVREANAIAGGKQCNVTTEQIP